MIRATPASTGEPGSEEQDTEKSSGSADAHAEQGTGGTTVRLDGTFLTARMRDVRRTRATDTVRVTDRVLLDPVLAPALAAAGLASADDLFTLGGDVESSHVVTEVVLDVEGTIGRFHLKRYHYASWRKARGLVGRGTLWGTAPEVNEFRALAWLRRHSIPAVRPVAAASRTRFGRLVTHALLTEHVPDAVDLARRLRTPGDPVREKTSIRRRVLVRIATHLTRMHAGGFVHRDGHARNILVRVNDDVQVFFLDCRRGGPGSWRRPPLYDLATLDRDLCDLVPATDRLRALCAWQGTDSPSRRLHALVLRRRERLRRRDERRGRVRE